MGQSQDLISVVVSVYNIENRLRWCLESLSAQTYGNLEILLVDDGSTDSSGRLCDKYSVKDPRVRVIHQEKGGPWAARNRGLAESNGEYVIFPDGDDYFHKDYIQLLYEAINDGGKEYPMAFCDIRKVESYDEDTQSDSIPVVEELNQQDLLSKMLVYPSCGYSIYGGCWNKLYRKAALPDPFQKEYTLSQDFDTNLRFLFLIDRAVYVHKVLYYWVQWPGQNTRSLNSLLVRDECRSRIYYDNLQILPAHLSFWRPCLLVNLYRRLIVWMDDAKGMGRYKSDLIKIRQLENKTICDLLSCRQIRFSRKVRFLLSLHAPLLLGLFGKKILIERA